MREGEPAGAVRPVSLFRAPVLHTPCQEVTEFGPGLEQLIADMFATMYAADGVGLAANQVGVPARVFVYDCPDDEDVQQRGHLVNPHLAALEYGDITGPEGCLSLPGLEARTARAAYARIEGVRSDGSPVTVEGEGFFARCLQHEYDHLEGLVYADRLGALRRRRLLRAAARADWAGAVERMPLRDPSPDSPPPAAT
ncbi:peptide deformylase [Streptomyces sp. XM4193]|uniref:peptide deformylase n=1 Tax=Streptomyces sp. XM4193 TaxID=2929782 RepID=UPI001FF88534|nr:peptide deformylase [Streptomyces sp. XM4193]MCK1797975.1 peptide deformylase [Streptomyces sp. XM4193]